jgi:hypothetical protein
MKQENKMYEANNGAAARWRVFGKRSYFGRDRRLPLGNVCGYSSLSNPVDVRWTWLDTLAMWIGVAGKLYGWMKGGCR